MTITPLAPAVTMTADPATGTAEQRAQLVQGLVDMAAFLAAHPSVPVLNYGHVSPVTCAYFPAGDMAAQSAGVDRVAALIGEAAGYRAGGRHYRAERHFGPSVLYQAVACAPRPAWNRAEGRKEQAA